MEEISWLKDVVFLIPIAGLIWKASSLSSKVKEHEAALKEIKTGLKEQVAEILKTLADLKTDLEVIKALRKRDLENEKDKQ